MQVFNGGTTDLTALIMFVVDADPNRSRCRPNCREI